MKIFKILKNKKIIIPLAIIFIVGAYFVFAKKEKIEYITAKVERGKILQTVSETGTVKAAKELDLNFLQSGKIAKINIKVGDKTKKDDVLAELDYTSLKISEQKVAANLAGAQASLSKLLAGVTASEIAVSEANVNQVKASYESAVKESDKIKNTVAENITQARKTLNDLESKANTDVTPQEQAVATAQTNLENTVSTYQKSISDSHDSLLTAIEAKISVAKTALDAINRIVTDEDAKDVLSIKNMVYLDFTKSTYTEAGNLISKTETSLDKAKTSQNHYDAASAANDELVALNKTFSSLSYCFKALENAITTSAFTQTELDAFKTNINTQITNITAAISLLETAKQNLSNAILSYNTNIASAQRNLSQAQTNLDNAILSAQNALANASLNGDQQTTVAESKADSYQKAYEMAKAQLAQLKSSARPQDITLAKAQVEQAQAGLDEVRKQIENSIIKAPIDGIITKINYEIGEDTTPTKAVISMLGNNNLEIEVLISEADVAKVKKDDKVEITLDAFGEDVKFSGAVYFIEPAETVVQDVIYYKAKIIFANESEFKANLANIKSGMTANITITTAQKDNVLIIPSRAIIEKNGNGKFIKLLKNNKDLEEVPVTIGLRGDGGMIEVLSGVKEGDILVTGTKNQQ